MKIKIISLLAFYFTAFSAFADEVKEALDTGTITIQGNVYNNTCSANGTSGASNLTIPTTYATDYANKGDVSPLGTSGNVLLICAGNSGMAGVYLTVDGEPDSTDPSLFKVTTGSDKAEGVAIKLYATPVISGSTIDSFELVPNQENSTLISNRLSNAPQFSWYFSAQAIAVADQVKGGDLSTNLTWTARYN